MNKIQSKLSYNITFIGNKLYAMPNPNKLIKFNMSALARDFGVKSTTIKDWINNKNISKTTLIRIAKISSNLLNLNITPQMMLNEDLATLAFPGKVSDQQALYGMDQRIFELLRHTLGTNLINSGYDMKEVQYILGHKTLYMTNIYTQMIPSKIKQKFEKFKYQVSRKISENPETESA